MYIVLDGEAVLEGLHFLHINWDCLQSRMTMAEQNAVQLNLLLEHMAADSEAASLLPIWVICHL
jgi:hypothetical protein